MPILTIVTPVTGFVGTIPRLIYVNCTDSLAQVIAPDYILTNDVYGNIYEKTDVFFIYSPQFVFNIFYPVFSQDGLHITLVPFSGASNVVLPVFNNHFAIFSGNTGLIKDGGLQGNASLKNVTDNTKPLVVSLGAEPTNPGHLAFFFDTTGTVYDGGITVTDFLQIYVASVFFTPITPGHIVKFHDIRGTIEDSGVVFSDATLGTAVNVHAPTVSGAIAAFGDTAGSLTSTGFSPTDPTKPHLVSLFAQPTIINDIALFADVNGTIKDANISPTDVLLTKVVSYDGSVASGINNIALFADTVGSIKTSGISPTAVLLNKVVSYDGSNPSIINNLAAFTDTFGSIKDSGAHPSDASIPTLASVVVPTTFLNFPYFIGTDGSIRDSLISATNITFAKVASFDNAFGGSVIGHVPQFVDTFGSISDGNLQLSDNTKVIIPMLNTTPVVTGNFASFSATDGTIQDSGRSPTNLPIIHPPVAADHVTFFFDNMGALYDPGVSVSDISQPYIASVASGTIPGDFPIYHDTHGTIIDTGIHPSDGAKLVVPMMNTVPVVATHFASFIGTAGTIQDAGYAPSDATKTVVPMLNATPVVVGNIATFSNVNGTIQDSGNPITSFAIIQPPILANHITFFFNNTNSIYDAGIGVSDITKTVIPMLNATPVVVNNIATFSATTGTIQDNGISPTDSTKTKLVSLNGASVVGGNFPKFSATNGTIEDSNISPSDDLAPRVASIRTPTVTDNNFAMFSGTLGTIYDAPLTPSSLGNSYVPTINAPFMASQIGWIPTIADIHGSLTLAPAVTAGSSTYVGGVSGTIPVPGIVSTQIAVCTSQSLTNPAYIIACTAGANVINLTFNVDPGSSVINFIVVNLQ